MKKKGLLFIPLVFVLSAGMLLSSCGGGASISTSSGTSSDNGNITSTSLETSSINESASSESNSSNSTSSIAQTYTVTFESDGGSEVPSQEVEKGNKVSKPTDPAKAGYTFIGWYIGEEEWSFIGNAVTEDTTLTAKWSINTYTITYNLNGGSNASSNPSTYTVEDNITLAEPTRTGYTFTGWTGEDITSPTKAVVISNSYKDLTYTANWEANIYTITYNLNGGTNASSNPSTYTVEDNITLAEPTRTGYTFTGWIGEDITSPTKDVVISNSYKDLSYTANWEANIYTITYNLNGGTNASSNPSTYTVEDNITLAEPTRTGYTFTGWTGEDITSPTKDVVISNSYKDLSYTANWEANIYTITYNLNGGTNASSNPSTYTVDDEIVFEDPTVANVTVIDGTCYKYEFGGWYLDSEFETPISEITRGTIGNIEVYAKITTTTITLESYLNNGGLIEYYLNNGGKYVRVDDNGNYSSTGSNIMFGTYPQSKVTDETTLDTLTTYVSETKPTSSDAQGFTSYKYYIESSNITDYMWYKDIDIDNNGNYDYRCVYFEQYRPYITGNSSSAYNSNQDNNGYYTGNYYFFKYEPIKWEILKEVNGKATILADLILDSQEFNYTISSQTVNGETIYSNNYEYSTIRKWLNDNFYNTAFNDLQKSIINIVEVDNSTFSTNSTSNSYACNNTNDKVWLLSYQDVYNTEYGFNSKIDRQKKTTDYAKCQGTRPSTYSSYLENGYWWLRSPYSFNDNNAFNIESNGVYYFIYVYYTGHGVVPALEITL